eukprot:GHVR01109947.1.p1 GENE.GHVR01109947.1~~GHVR01109947.1.p1  ORF type:complete len:216 (-),score=44.91 GHVR01109947.1:315-962(-)
MLQALQALAEKNVTHRDIKPQNFMFDSNKADAKLKLIDFGLAVELSENQTVKQISGTLHYLAPEVVRGKADIRGDMWALGLIVYVMTYGDLPFTGDDDAAIMRKILRSPIVYQKYVKSCVVSNERISFLKGMLQKDPRERFTPSVALEHPFIRETDPERIRERGTCVDASIISSARRRSEAAVKRGPEGRRNSAQRRDMKSIQEEDIQLSTPKII